MGRRFQDIVIGPAATGSARQAISASEVTDQILDVIYQDDFSVRKVMIQNLDIEGALGLSGISDKNRLPPLHISNCAVKSLSLRSSACSNLVVASSDIGQIDCYGASFEGRVELQRVNLSYPDDQGEPGAINLYAAKITHDLFMDKVVVKSEGELSFVLTNAAIGGRMVARNCQISCRMILQLACIDKGISIERGVIVGPILITSLRLVDGGIHINGTSLGDGAEAIKGHGASIAGAFAMRPENISGVVEVIFSDIGASLEINKAVFGPESIEQSLVLQGSRIGGSVQIHESRFHGTVRLDGVSTGGDVYVTRSSIYHRKHRSGYSFSGWKLSVGQNIDINEVSAFGGISLEHSAISGSMRIKKSKICYSKSNSSSRGGINLRRISSGTIFLESLECVLPVVAAGSQAIPDAIGFHDTAPIFLNGAKIETVDFSGDLGAVVLDLQDAHMERLPHPETTKVEAYVNAFNENAKRYYRLFGHPYLQPYLMLARCLRAAGWHDAADRALVEMKRQARRTGKSLWTRLGLWIFDATFGFGYSRTKAAVTLAVWVALGTLGTAIALRTDALIIDAAPVMAGVSDTGPDSTPPAMPVYVLTQTAGETAIPCGSAIDPFFYAVELVLPVFDLGQKDQCTLRGGTDQDHSFWLARDYVWWWFGKYLYTIFGWVIVSLAILTFFGALKNRSDGSLS